MTLTPLQKKIVKLIADGLTYKAIGQRLGKNERICRHHACEAQRKVCPDSKLPTKAALALWWSHR